MFSPSLHLLCLLASLSTACATAQGTFEPLGPSHPASPQAAEIPIENPSAFLDLEESSTGPQSSDAPLQAPDLPGAYVCPMHKEISSDQPGVCPKCGMQLVKRESTEPEHEHGNEHGD